MLNNAEDHLAPEARSATNRPPLIPPFGVSGLRQFSGYVREEFLPELIGDRGRRIFEEMSKNDSTCGAILFAIKNLLRSLDWTVTSADPSNDAANEARDLLDGMLMGDMDHTWPEFIEAACSMFTFGFSMHEIVWKRRNGLNISKPWLSSDYDDGLYAPAAFSPRSQKTIQHWVYDGADHLLGFEQTPYDGIARTVPITRCLHFRTTAELDNPEGQSSLRTAYRSWYWLKRLQEIEGIGTERDLAGYPVITVPGVMLGPEATPEMAIIANRYQQMLQEVRRDKLEGMLLPSDRDEKGNLHYEFKLLSSGGTRQLNINESINRYERAIARAVLADFIFLGADGGGSLALGKTKVQFFIEAMKAYAQQMARQINEVAVAQIWRLNGLDVEVMPTVEPGEIEQPDLEGMASFLTAMVGAGFDMGTDVELENHLRGLADFPEAPDRTEDDDFDVMPSGRAVPVLPEMDDPEGGNPGGSKPGAAPGGKGANPGAAVEKALGEALRDRFGFDMEAVLKAFNATQPRVPSGPKGGQWTTGGGSGGVSNVHLRALINNPDATMEDMLTDQALNPAIEEMASISSTETLPQFGTDTFWSQREYKDGDGNILKGREAAVKHLTEAAATMPFTDDKIPVPKDYQLAFDRKVTILMGAPAAGKSTLANPHAREMKAMIVDGDEAKKLIPEYRGGIGAGAVHEESSILGKDMLTRAIDSGANLVIPKVGDSPRSIEKLVNQLQQNGYSVNIALMDVEPKVAVKRMIGRYISKGRLIPPDYMRAAVLAPPKTYDILKSAGIGNSFSRVDNSGGKGEVKIIEGNLEGV